jgi:hypothetical protein
MRKLVFGLFLIGVLFFSPRILLADCLSLGGYTSWVLMDEKMIFYRGSRPLAAVKIQDCRVRPNSQILFVKSYMCDGDKLLVDGEECSIFSLDSLAF